MNFNELVSFDIRKTYLMETELKSWDKQNILYNTLWFENEDRGSDVEYCTFSVYIFKLYSFYSDWDKVDHKGGGYILNKSSDFKITADVMNGWWYPLKRYFKRQNQKISKKDSVSELVKEVEEAKYKKDNDLIKWLSDNYNQDKKICEALLKFLDNVYTIGNISPAGNNSGTGGFDFWNRKLELLKDNWFDKSYQDKKDIYQTAINNPKNRNNTLKWAPFLWECFTDHDSNNPDNEWKKFIDENFYQDYVKVEEKYNIRPLLETTTAPEDEDLCEKMKEITERIKERGKKIIDMYNRDKFQSVG